MVSAVVDQIIDGEHAVLLIGADESEYTVSLSLLPDGIKEGLWLRVRLEDNRLVAFALDEQATEDAKRRIASKMDLLRKRGRGREKP